MTRYPRSDSRGLIEGHLYEIGSGNVFADLDLPNSDQELLKAQLTVQIYRLVKERGLTQTKGAELLGTTKSQFWALMRCRRFSFSAAGLMNFLTVLGQDVEIKIKPAAPKHKGHMSLVVERV